MRKIDFIRGLFLTILLLVGAVAGRAEAFETVINNGPSVNRIDVAILGDGYTAGEMAAYRAAAANAMAGYFNEQPYREYQRYFNVHRIDVVSNQSGADHPERSPAVFVDTALNATFNCSGIVRLICVTNSRVNEVISRTLQPSQYDIILVIVNDAQYGGSGGPVAVASTHTDAIELVLHEVGHSFGLLADEYGGNAGPSCNPNVEPGEPNATRATTRGSIKWNHWIDAATAIPTIGTAAATPGLYQGANYCDVGLYRPTNRSKMNVLNNPFEQINVEQHVKRIYSFASPIDSISPASNGVSLAAGQNQAFAVALQSPFTHSLDVVWQVDGQNAGTGPTFNLAAASLSAGEHTVRVAISDATAYVRNDPFNLLKTQRFWTVIVTPAAQTHSVSGRVLSPTGAPLRSVVVVLTDSAGNRRTVTTSSFGVYQFNEISSGSGYTLSAASKRYRFAPHQLEINGSLTNINFFGQE
jgi:hypothetical protein